MGQVLPRQRPAIALRSHSQQLRSLLALALVVVAGLSVAVILATNDKSTTTASSAKPAVARPDESKLAAEISRTQLAIGRAEAATPDVATPDESKLAVAISRAQLATASPEVAMPDESKHAVAVSAAQQAGDQSGPDESSIAAAIGRHQSGPGGPDESSIAAAIGR